MARVRVTHAALKTLLYLPPVACIALRQYRQAKPTLRTTDVHDTPMISRPPMLRIPLMQPLQIHIRRRVHTQPIIVQRLPHIIKKRLDRIGLFALRKRPTTIFDLVVVCPWGLGSSGRVLQVAHELLAAVAGSGPGWVCLEGVLLARVENARAEVEGAFEAAVDI